MKWRIEEDGARVFYIWADVLVGSGQSVEQAGKAISEVLHDRHRDVLDGTGWAWTEDESGREMTAGTIYEVVLTNDDEAVAVRATLTSLPDLIADIERVELLDGDPSR